MANRIVDTTGWGHQEHQKHMKLLETIGAAILAAYTCDPRGFHIKGRITDYNGMVGYQYLLGTKNWAVDVWIDPKEPSGQTDNFIDAIYMSIERIHQMRISRSQELLANGPLINDIQTHFQEHREERETQPGFYTLNTFINTHEN